MSEPITEEQLAEWEALAEKAMPGPWIDDGVCIWSEGGDGGKVLARRMFELPSPNDAAFMVAARTAVPALIAELRKCQRERDEWKGKVDIGQIEAVATFYSRLDKRWGDKPKHWRSESIDELVAWLSERGMNGNWANKCTPNGAI